MINYLFTAGITVWSYIELKHANAPDWAMIIFSFAAYVAIDITAIRNKLEK